jgi:hypothetical protein
MIGQIGDQKRQELRAAAIELRSESNSRIIKYYHCGTITLFFFGLRNYEQMALLGKQARTDLLEVAEAVVHGEHRRERVRGLPLALRSGRSCARIRKLLVFGNRIEQKK